MAFWWIAPLVQSIMSSSNNKTANTVASAWSATANKGTKGAK